MVFDIAFQVISHISKNFWVTETNIPQFLPHPSIL